jgi:hypothetical protein
MEPQEWEVWIDGCIAFKSLNFAEVVSCVVDFMRYKTEKIEIRGVVPVTVK